MREGETRGVIDHFLARFSRRTTSGRYIPQIDGLRFVAIASVVVFHTQAQLYQTFVEKAGRGGEVPLGNDPLGVLIGQGRLGVHVFFVISGFVIGLPFVAHRLARGPHVSLRRYFLRRLTRIEPPYLVVLFGLSFLAVTTQLWVHRNALPRLAAGSFYGNSLIFGDRNPINPAFWTLEVEVQFYIVAPILALLFLVGDTARRRLLIVLSAASITAVQAGLGMYGIPRVSGSVLSYLQFFLVGFLLADLYLVDWREHPSTHGAWDLVSAIGWPLFFALGIGGRGVIHTVLPWLALVLFVAAFRGPLTSRILSDRWIRTIGGMCYSIYLIHTPLLLISLQHTRSLASDSFGTANALAQVTMLAPFLLAVSAAFFLLVEKPCMDPRWPSRLLGALRGRSRTEAPVVATPVAGIVDLTSVEPSDAMTGS